MSKKKKFTQQADQSHELNLLHLEFLYGIKFAKTRGMGRNIGAQKKRCHV
jgi:hypothetical protein